MKSWSVVLLLFCSANLSACSGGDNNGDEGNGSGELPAGNVTVKITPDKKTVLRNPLNGWVIYMGRGWDENFWTTEGYDNVSVPELAEPVKVSEFIGAGRREIYMARSDCPFDQIAEKCFGSWDAFVIPNCSGWT